MEWTTAARRGILLAVWGLSLLIPGRTASGRFIYGEPTKIPKVSRSGASSPQISRDGLELYFVWDGDNACQDIWVAKRSSLTPEWEAPVRLDAPVNSEWPAYSPCLSANGLELYFSDAILSSESAATGCVPNPAGYGGGDLWVARRATRDDPWDEPVNLGSQVNTSSYEDHPSLTSDGLSLYFASDRSGAYALWMTTRDRLDAPWQEPQKLGSPVDMIMYEVTPFISPDGLSLYFSMGGWTSDIYVSRRTSVAKSWGQPTLFSPVDSAGAEYRLSFAAGDSTVYFTRGDSYSGPFDLWQMEVAPDPDLNDDDVVDTTDIALLLDRWGHTSAYDIGPRPLGDGLIGDTDLEILYEYVDDRLAVVPTPMLNETDVSPFVSLNWTRGLLAPTYDVYFGTSFDDVADATRADPRGVLVSQEQADNNYDPAETLELGQTYHWRVDEVNSLADPAIVPGVVWSFTTQPSLESEPAAIRVFTVTASSSHDDRSPECTIDGSGLDAYDLHSTSDTTMWLSAADGPQPTWIQYEFDGVYPVETMRVWNYNGSFEQVIGNGFRDVTVQYSPDGATWTMLADVEFARGTSLNDYAANTVIDFDGVTARYVRLTVQSNWGGLSAQYGLSEVRFFYVLPATVETETADN